MASVTDFKVHETGTTLIDRTIQAESINVGVLKAGSESHGVRPGSCCYLSTLIFRFSYWNNMDQWSGRIQADRQRRGVLELLAEIDYFKTIMKMSIEGIPYHQTRAFSQCDVTHSLPTKKSFNLDATEAEIEFSLQ